MKPIDKITEQRIFTILRLALWNREEDMSVFNGITEAEWDDIYRICVDQAVIAVAFDGVMRLPDHLQPGLDNRVQWGFNVGNIEKIYGRQRSAAQKLVKAFAAEGIRTMIMKGLSVARYYPTPSHRQFGDIDIYLLGDYARGNELVVSRGGKLKHEFFVHTEFRVDGVNVENHEIFVNAKVNRTGAYVQRELERIVGNGLQPLAAVEGAYAPSPEFDALFLTRHATWHYARECITLRDLCDWAAFVNATADTIDTGSVMRALAESKLERYAAIVTGICREYLGLEKSLPFTNEYPDLVERVKEDILTFENPDKHRSINFIGTFYRKLRNRFERKWCYDQVVPDSFYGNIFYSVRNYLSRPLAIFKAKI